MPRRDRVARAQYQREFIRTKLMAGLCPVCGTRKSARKRKSCAAYLRAAANRQLAYVAREAAKGRCHRCKGRLSTKGCLKCRALRNLWSRNSRAKAVSMVLAHYGSVCACCGESQPLFLTLDHKKGGGTQHRVALKRRTLQTWLRSQFLKKGRWPSGYQTLCHNCNCGRWRNGGKCPHKEKVECL
jgi:hypothetical protein